MIVHSRITFAKVIIEWHSEDLSNVLLVSWQKVVVVTPLFKFLLNISSDFYTALPHVPTWGTEDLWQPLRLECVLHTVQCFKCCGE